jgi:hypothetical protein
MRSTRLPKRFIVALGVCAITASLLSTNDGTAAGPPAPPATTSDLSGVTQNWDKNLPSASRFTVLPAFNNQAVRDNNTGLVWEQAPSTQMITQGFDRQFCLMRNVGNSRGWHVPSIAELVSLIDPSLPPPFVPTNIFTGIQAGTYLSSTNVQNSAQPGSPWVLSLDNGLAFNFPINGNAFVWCVRGPTDANPY